MHFAARPPEDGDYLVAELWDRHLPFWRGKAASRAPRDSEQDRELVDQLTRFTAAQTLRPDEVQFEPNDAELLSIQRSVHKRKGAWWQLPKDLQVLRSR